MPGLKSPTGAQNSPVEKPCNIILYFVGCPPRSMVLDDIVSLPTPTISVQFLLYVFSCRRSMLVGSCLFFLPVLVLQIVVIWAAHERTQAQGLSALPSCPVSVL